MRKLLFTILPLCLLLASAGTGYAQDARMALSGKWALTDAYYAGSTDAKDAQSSVSAREDLLEKNKLEYHFTDSRLTILVNGNPTFLYNYTIDGKGMISIDEPVKDAFVMMWNLKLVEAGDRTLTLKCDSPDDDNRYIYQVFTKL